MTDFGKGSREDQFSGYLLNNSDPSNNSRYSKHRKWWVTVWWDSARVPRGWSEDWTSLTMEKAPERGEASLSLVSSPHRSMLGQWLMPEPFSKRRTLRNTLTTK